MIDTTTTTALARAAIENTKPSSPAEFYVLVVVAGVVVCWGVFWYLYWNFKSKKGANENGGQTGIQPINEHVYRLHPEDRSELEMLKEGFKQLSGSVAIIAESFKSIVHERGDTMKEIGELKGVVDILKEKDIRRTTSGDR